MDKRLTDNVLAAGGWQCPDCKVCQVCHRRGRSVSLLLCDRCDRGLHMSCAQPPLEAVPEGDFVCDACKAQDAAVAETAAEMVAAKAAAKAKAALATTVTPPPTPTSSHKVRKARAGTAARLALAGAVAD